ncbi:hypothetical protein PENTCL1PPCAC_9226, partial [Pristionchus entomophagus]
LNYSFTCVHDNKQAMVMEYVDRNLRQHLDSVGMLNKQSFLEIAGGIADGLAYIHDLNMVHRDIKTDNILVHLSMTGKSVPKICDFGIARDVPEQWTRMRIIGSYPYMAPELLVPERPAMTTRGDDDAVEERWKQLAKLEPRIDTWSFGCVAWEILTGLVPFGGCYQVTLPTMVARGQMSLPLPPQTSVESLQNMLKRCLQTKPENR